MMTRAEVILSQKLLFVFRCFANKMVLFGSLKAKQLILVSKIILTYPYVASRDLQSRRKPYKFGVQVSSSRLCSLQALGSIQRDRLHANIAEWSLFNVLRKLKVANCRTLFFQQFLIQLLPFKRPEIFQLALPNSKTQFQIFSLYICHLTFVLRNFKNKTWVGECFRSLPNRHN